MTINDELVFLKMVMLFEAVFNALLFTVGYVSLNLFSVLIKQNHGRNFGTFNFNFLLYILYIYVGPVSSFIDTECFLSYNVIFYLAY